MSSQLLPAYILPVRPTIWPSRTLREAGLDVFALPISHVSIMGTPIADGQFFHFTLAFLGASDHDSKSGRPTIQLDMSPSYTDMRCPMQGIVQVMYELITDSLAITSVHGTSPASFEVPICRESTVGALCDFLLSNCKMDQYIFSDEGQGCRHWCATALAKLAMGGFLEEGITEAFVKYETDGAEVHGHKFPMPRIRGTFY